MLVSFLLPTRKRIEMAINSIKSIVNNAKDKNCFEILIAFDDDDLDTKIEVEKFLVENNINYKSIVTERFGYHGLHEYYNRLIKLSSSHFCWLWNDDAILETENWDEILDVNEKPAIYKCLTINNQSLIKHPANIFPLWHKKITDILGHVSCSPHNDTWLEQIAAKLKIHKVINIHVNHLKTDIEFNKKSDYKEIYQEVHNSWKNHNTKKIHNSLENQKNLRDDIEKLLIYL